MRVRLLGGFEVEGVAARDLGSRKGRTLLKLLAVARGSSVSVDRIADVLWGDRQPARPADQVGVLVSRLRGAVGGDRIRRTDAGYSLAAGWLDVDEVARLGGVAAEALGGGRVAVARAAVDAGLALARGQLLPDEDGEWVEAERAAAAAAVGRLQRLAVDAAAAAGDHGAVAALAEGALASDPYDEVVLRALMEAHLAAGRPASALAAYARVRERLAEDLGVPPTAATEEVHGRALAAADGDTLAAPVGAVAGPGAPPGVVGRDTELGVLDAALVDAARGGVALVVVEGDAGIGKTTLVDGWSRLPHPDTTVLRGRCDELGRDLPLQPVADALAGHLRAIGPEAAAAVVGDDADALAPVLGPVVGAAATVVTDAEASRARVYASLAAVLARAAGDGTTALVVEDLHLAGTGTLAWLAFARRRCRRTLIVVTSRPGGRQALDPTHHVTLGPLERDAVARLVGAERVDALYERSGGHPLLLSAFVSAGDDDLPATLADAVAASVDSVGRDVGATLRVAALLGVECDLDLIAHLSGTPAVDVLAHLEAAQRAGLVVERGSRFAFRHELVREALQAATGAARRALVHHQAARALAARPDPDALAVAVHARAGGDLPLAASSFVAAAAAAAGRSDLEAAEEHLAAAIELAPSAEAYVARARTRMSRLAMEAARDDAEQAIALGGGAAACEVAGWVAYYRRRYDEARAYADEAAARAGDDALRVSASALAGRVRHGAGDLEGAEGHLAVGGDGPPGVRGVADAWLAQLRVHQGRPQDALAALARPLVDPDALAHPWAPLHLRFSRIAALGQLGRVAEALQVADELDAAVLRKGDVGVRFAGVADNVGAWVLRWSGRAAEADERNRRAYERTGGAGGPWADAVAEPHYVSLLDLADGCLLRDDPAGAAALVERLAPVETWPGTMAWHQRHRLGVLRARLALVEGDRTEAAERASAVAGDAAGRGATRYELLARAVLGLADRSLPTDDLAAVVDGLGRCAALDGWHLVAALASTRGVDAWRAAAERVAAAVVAASGPHADAAGRFADRLLTATSRS